MKKNFFDILIWVVTLIFVIMIFFMPDTVPIHWNYDWEIDGYGSRYMMFILAGLPMISYYGMLLTKRIDPKRKKLELREKTYNLFRYGVSIFLIVMSAFFYYMVLFPKSDTKYFILLSLGILLIGMGNYMPKIPQNYFLGIKTPWTLSNEYVWHKTHKIGGYSYVLIGIVVLICGILGVSCGYSVLIGLLVIDVIFNIVYSYVIYRQLESKNH